MRIDKFLSDNSIGTRKEIKGIIKAGRITVNGVQAGDPGMHIDPGKDIVTIDGSVIEYEKFHYYMLNKPAGTVSSTREGASVTVVELLAGENVKNLSPVGRLDKDTEGLLLITNDGALAHELLSPKKHVKKTYIAVCRGVIDPAIAARMEAGLDLGDFITAPAEVSILMTGASDTVVAITITEGKNHQVKRMAEAVGSEVLKLRRIRMGGLWLPRDLASGECKEYEPEELRALLKEENEEDLERLYRSYL